MLRITFLVLLFTMTLPVLAQDRPLVLGFMPYLNVEDLLKKYSPLAEYLSHELDWEVQVRVAKDYATHIRQVGEDQIDIAFLGGSPYVVIGDQYGNKPLLVRYEFEGKPTFTSVIFVARDSPLQSLSDLRGHRVAFGNKNSTLSSQVPLYMLMQAGVGLTELAGHDHLRNHENVLLGVEYGDFDAGAAAEEVFREKGSDALRTLAVSPEISTHVFVTRANMAAELRETIRQALLGLSRDNPQGEGVLKAIGGKLTGFVPVVDEDYDLLREILARVLPALEQ
jgi:phosphonate transport system substrate-binding protein